MFKKIISISLAVVSACAINATIIKNTKTASANARSEIAMELTTGKVLSEGNADEKMPMASTTKIMTALVIIENCNLDEVITVDDRAVGVEGSSIYLKKQEQIDVRDLLYGLMLRSGNDSATALAIHHSGSIEKFAEIMTNRAKEIGAENTNFKNPSGLNDPNHYTTARDLCKIARQAMLNETFKEIVSTKSYKGKFRSYVNKNKMLNSYEGANGVKTGYTVKAGRCLVSSAERDGMDVVCVVLNCPDMYERSSAILDSCFNNFCLNRVENKLFMCNRVLCKPTKCINLVCKKGENLTYKVIPDKIEGKIKEGDCVGHIEIYGENNLLFSDKLYSIISK